MDGLQAAGGAASASWPVQADARLTRAHTPLMYHGEKLNAISHLVATALALAGAVVLVVLAAHSGDPWKVVSVSIYGLTLVLLYAFSVLYHSLRGRAKLVLQKLDHLSIYLLIAGSHTPFCLVSLRGVWGWSLFGVIWGLAFRDGRQRRPGQGDGSAQAGDKLLSATQPGSGSRSPRPARRGAT